MTSAVAQSWLDTAAFQVQDKRRILAEVKSVPDMPPEAIECAENLLFLCEILLERATVKYLESVKKNHEADRS